MKTITLGKLAQIMGGNLIKGNGHSQVRALNYGKPKHLESHQVYIYKKSIKWEKQQSALRRVRPLAIVIPTHLSPQHFPKACGIIRVNDPSKAFWNAAIWNWKQLRPRVIGITGSAGKSTTTEMVASILKRKWSMVKTQGNLNTFTFLPSYLARLKPHHRLLLLEMGMKSLNNIRRQCQVVRPEIGVVTNVGEAHVGSLGGLNVVVRAKQEMIDGVRDGGTILLNNDDQRSKRLSVQRFRGKVKKFGIHNPAAIRASHVQYTDRGMSFLAHAHGKEYPVRIPVFGTHNVYHVC